MSTGSSYCAAAACLSSLVILGLIIITNHNKVMSINIAI
jgi:hypothetical protein